eukprot:TRINITY_DN57_c0_g2_i1.p1 TRINITY_DN57_c0_g2~~TRINITY_DN57_c0_g2_i1.p1  ORF type:complete len:674 (+),score=242.97 TRINITY_DN57_c0_g2_i1:158-2179(+)
MQCRKVILAIALAAAFASASQVTPVQKVIQMMEGMKAKGVKEMNDEKAQYATYKRFCDDTTTAKKRAIAEASEKMEMLSASIEKNGEDAEQLAYEIKGHVQELETASKEKDEATAVRKTEEEAFKVTQQDFTESLDALNRALEVLKAQKDRKQVASFLQLTTKLKLLPSQAKDKIGAFIMLAESAAPEAEGYETQSGGVIDMLMDLRTEFMTQKMALEKDEAAKRQAFMLLSQGLTNQITNSKKNQDDKTEFKAQKQQAESEAKADLSETTASRAADQKYHDDLAATCEKKADDFNQRTKLRKEEIDAVQKAIDIISSGAVAGSAETHLPSLLQAKRMGASLAQLRRSALPAQERVAQFLEDRAGATNNKQFALLATEIREVRAEEGNPDILAKVRGMIKELILKIKKDVADRASHKEYCDTELAENEKTRAEKTDAVDGLNAQVDELKSVIAELTEEISTASKEISELNQAVREATEVRQVEKANNTATLKDAREAQEAVASAIGVLNEFYAKAATATSLVQTGKAHRFSHKQPEIFDKPYTGMSTENGGVIGLLEVIESDFARLEAETSAAENAAAKEFEEFMEDSKYDKAKKEKDIEHKSTKKAEKLQYLDVAEADLHGMHKELDAANAYYEKLKPECTDRTVTYQMNKEQREEELKDLQKALDVLNAIR